MVEQEAEEHRYPNTGHLGLSSSATIFNRLPVGNEIEDISPAQPTPVSIILSLKLGLSECLLETWLAATESQLLRSMAFYLRHHCVTG